MQPQLIYTTNITYPTKRYNNQYKTKINYRSLVNVITKLTLRKQQSLIFTFYKMYTDFLHIYKMLFTVQFHITGELVSELT